MRKANFQTILTILLLTVPVMGQVPKIEQVRTYYETAQKLETEGKWKEAEEVWRASLKVANDDARAWTNLGVALNRQDKTTEAIEAWRKAISLDPKLPGPYFNLGLTLVRKGDYANSIAPLRKTLAFEPDNVGARRALAVALMGTEKFQEASREIAQLLFRSPKDAGLLELAAQSFMRQRRYQKPQLSFSVAQAYLTQTAFLWSQYGDALDGAGRTPEAVDAYKKAVEIDPESTLTRYGLGYLHWKLYQYADAERELLEVLRREPNDPRASFTLGDIYLTKGDGHRALPLLEIARNCLCKRV